MLKSITYRGALVSDTDIPGERKADGIFPGTNCAPLQVSRDRFVLFFGTRDPNGWDAVRSILYQVREGAPDGRVLNEGIVAQSAGAWDPYHNGMDLRKVHGMPMPFGVPKGATRKGQVLTNHNVFAVKWYRYAMLEKDGRLISPLVGAHHDIWPSHLDRLQTLRIEWMQFRLNDAEDDIEILQAPQLLTQRGYDSEDEICALGPGRHMNHAMSPPVAADDSCMTWCECDTFAPDPDAEGYGHGQLAPVEYAWNAQTGLYEWSRVGALHMVRGRAIGESSISRWGDTWLVASRSNHIDGSTVWYRTDDLFAGMGEPILQPCSFGPRISFRCADDVLRLSYNDRPLSPYGHTRNPLHMIEVDPQTLEASNPIEVLDACKAQIPFEVPFVDMAEPGPAQGNRQILTVRTLDKTLTTDPDIRDPALAAKALGAAGIHYVELEYEDDVAPVWVF